VWGGSDGNERLTAKTAAVLLVLLAAEGVTIAAIGRLLAPHVFIGFLLIPIVLLKLASIGWRMSSYYAHRDAYVRRGPPGVLMRIVVAPAVVASTIAVFASGVAAVALHRRGVIVGVHKLSFIVWFGAMTIHVLGHASKLPRLVRDRLPGSGLRWAVVGATFVAGAVLATATVPLADRWQDRATAIAHIDSR
jgi:hypothetical protein